MVQYIVLQGYYIVLAHRHEVRLDEDRDVRRLTMAFSINQKYSIIDY